MMESMINQHPGLQNTFSELRKGIKITLARADVDIRQARVGGADIFEEGIGDGVLTLGTWDRLGLGREAWLGYVRILSRRLSEYRRNG